MADIRVESFDVAIGNGSTHTLTTALADTTRSFIRRPGPSDKCTGGPTGSTANTAPHLAHAGVAITGASTLTFYAPNTTSRRMMGEVWEYTGSAGGANEFIKRGSYAVTSTGASTTQAVSGIVDRNKCVPFITGVSFNNTSVSEYEKCTFYAYINASDQLVIGKNNTATGATVYVDVVEFTGSNWSVGHGISSSHDSVDETVTLNTDSTGSGGTTFDVGDWETAFIEINMGGDSAETGLSDVLATAYPAGTTTQVVFCFEGDGDGNAANDSDAYIHVVQNDSLIVKRASITNISEGNGTYGTAAWPAGASTTRNLDELALEWFADTTGTGTAHARARLNARITSATGTIQHWVHRSGNDIDVHYGVIDLSQVVSAGGTDALIGQDLTSTAPTIDAPDIGQGHDITGQDVTGGTTAIDTPTLGQDHDLIGTDVTAGTPTLDTPSVSDVSSAENLTGQDLTAYAPNIDAPTIAQTHAIGGLEITAGTPAVDSADIGQAHAFTTILDGSAPVVDAPLIGQVHVLDSVAIDAGFASVAAATLTQTHIFATVDLAAVPIVDVPDIGYFEGTVREVYTFYASINTAESHYATITTAAALRATIATAESHDTTLRQALSINGTIQTAATYTATLWEGNDAEE